MKQTELITNSDGSVFHLHLKPGDIANKIIIVGDPGRVKLVSSYFNEIDKEIINREFHTVTGSYQNKKVSVISSGIGTDNIDILINELDAVFNWDLLNKTENKERKSLELIRLGTSGGLQPDIDTGSFLVTEKAIGFDGVMNFYRGIESITDLELENALVDHTGWSERLPKPYVINANQDLLQRFLKLGLHSGLTVSAPGFYAPQGRRLSLEPVDIDINDKLESFRFNGLKISNYEMESSALYGLSKLLGHKALTICSVIGNRVTGRFVKDYEELIRNLTVIVLENI